MVPKGVFDILPEEPKLEHQWRNSDRWLYVETVMRQTAHDYGYREIRTPLFERTELFVRGVGEGSDIVSKEMYTFEDKGGRSLTLRPEGTAPVMRAFIENRLSQTSAVHKFYYIAPMFRYERPQSGRYRQHHQFGVEAIGNPHPEQDVELIDLLSTLYRRLGLRDLTVAVNSVGNLSSRSLYREALQSYLRPFLDQLSPDSQNRFSKNPLRILDSKDPQDQQILEGAPRLDALLDAPSQHHFHTLCQWLEKLRIPFQVNPRLVRGLDYYNHTVFEITSGALGAQNSIGGGGRFDGLLSTLGGPDLPAAGFGTGIERLLQTMAAQNAPIPPPPRPFLFLIPLGSAAGDWCFQTLCALRQARVPSDIALHGKKVQHGLQLANTCRADYVLVIGDDELASGQAQLKDMRARTAQPIHLSQAFDAIKILYDNRPRR
jgi:histidyl-tRNA synthetase